jgi:hypothetical protein
MVVTLSFRSGDGEVMTTCNVATPLLEASLSLLFQINRSWISAVPGEMLLFAQVTNKIKKKMTLRRKARERNLRSDFIVKSNAP